MITKAALLLFRDNQGVKELLFTREEGKSFYAFPGDKQDPGETVEQALQRELDEELGARAADVRKLGVVSGQTPDGRDIEMHLYTGVLLGEPTPLADIAEIAWFGKDDVTAKGDAMTPMTLTRVMPLLDKQGLWQA